MRRIAGILLFSVVVVVGGCSVPRRMGRADWYFNHGWYWSAQKTYLGAAHKDPHNILAWAAGGLAASARREDAQAYRILREGALANPGNLILPLVACEVIGYTEPTQVAIMDQMAEAQDTFFTMAYDHGLAGEILDRIVTGEESEREIEEVAAPKRLEIIQTIQPKANAGKATAEQLLLLGVAYGTGPKPDRAKAEKYLDRAIKHLPKDVVAHYQRIYVKRFLAHRKIWRMLSQKNPDRKAAQEKLKPLLIAVHEAMVALPENYVPLLALRTRIHSPYLYQYYVPWARDVAKKHPQSAVAQFMAVWAMDSYTRLGGASPERWDKRAKPDLDRAIKLAPGWWLAKDLRERAAVLDKMTRGRPIMPRKFDEE